MQACPDAASDRVCLLSKWYRCRHPLREARRLAELNSKIDCPCAISLVPLPIGALAVFIGHALTPLCAQALCRKLYVSIDSASVRFSVTATNMPLARSSRSGPAKSARLRAAKYLVASSDRGFDSLAPAISMQIHERRATKEICDAIKGQQPLAQGIRFFCGNPMQFLECLEAPSNSCKWSPPTNNPWLVQMFDVALPRRICCSRACRAARNPPDLPNPRYGQ